MKHDVCIRFAETPSYLKSGARKGIRYYISDKNFLLKFDKIANFYVTNGKKIVIQRSKKATNKDIKSILLTTIIGVLLNQRGFYPIHASAVVHNNNAIVFSGIPGSGKSTLATNFAKHGFKVITDDIAAIKLIDNKPCVVPSFPSLRLWQDAISSLDLQELPFTKIRKGIQKKRVVFQDWFTKESHQIKTVFVIKTSNNSEFSVSEINGLQKFNYLKNNTYRLKLIEGKASQLAFFNQLAKISENVKLFEINRPKDPFKPNLLFDLVLKILSENE